MKKPVEEYTDEEINKRLEFAEKLMFVGGVKKKLPKHLEEERKELLKEFLRRKEKIHLYEDKIDMIEL